MQKSETGKLVIEKPVPVRGLFPRNPRLGNDPFKHRLAMSLAAVTVCFSLPLVQLVKFSLASQLYSYVLLIPAISLYLAWTTKSAPTTEEPDKPLTIGFAAIAVALLAVYWLVVKPNALPNTDRLCVLVASFVFSIFAVCAFCLGRVQFCRLAFPILFLVFMIPLPGPVERGFEAFLQHGSAEASYWLLRLSGTTMFREGTLFMLPGISLEVAPECSGIRSTLVLFLTSLVAGHLFLRSRWNRVWLASAVIALGILRNAFRIFTLAQLCIHISPTMIKSPLHHSGGPIFFALSLIPLFLLMWFLRKRERRLGNAD